MGVPESMVDVAVVSKDVGRLEVGPGLASIGRPSKAMRNLIVVPDVRAYPLEGVRQLGEAMQRCEGWAVELSHF